MKFTINMDKQKKLDSLYMDIAERIGNESHGKRAKVGALLVKGDNIISMGWNGTPSGDDNSCEYENENGELVTKREVLHAESNALMKLVSSGFMSAENSTLYVTLSPCFDCAKLIKQAKIKRLVYKNEYRDISGLDFLSSRGVEIKRI